jgi:DNA-binding CsgD family transcriptional regulator
MRATTVPIVGREKELGVVGWFLQELAGPPASLVLEGVAGIGKTAIWTEAVATARANGAAVRTCRCGQADAGWAFAGLGDLLDGLSDDVAAELPAVQQRALSAAMLQSEAPAAALGERVVGMAVLGVLRTLTRSEPLLLAIDDIQWLDPSSRKVLSFALRRLHDRPVRLLASSRVGPMSDAAEETDLGLPGERLVVGPVSVGTVQRIVATRLEMSLSRPTLTRLHQATGGNPMVCLEMARALQRRGREPAADEPLPVPSDLRVLVAERLRGLSEQARELLLLTAAMAHPTINAVAAVMAAPPGAPPGLAEAVAAGVIELDGERLRFTHPLVASIPYADLTPDVRRQLHARLADAITDPEEHARHAALGSTGADAAVAASLDVAARRARSRGSIDAAAELAELAIGRTPVDQPDELLRRAVDAADYLFRLGDPAKARAVLTGRLEATTPGPARVRGLLLLATITSWEEGDASVAQLCDQAITEAGTDQLLLALCHATYAETSPSGPAVDLRHAQTAVDLLEALESPPSDVLSNALTNVALHGLRLGGGLAVETLERAVALQVVAKPPAISDRAGTGLGMCLKVIDRFDESRRWLHAMRASAVEEGDDISLPNTLGHLALLECWAGEYALALEYALQGRELAAQPGINAPFLASAHVLVLAHLGRLSEAREIGEADLATAEPDYQSAVALHVRSLGFTELAAGNPATAAAHFLRALSIAAQIGVDEPAIMRLHPDAVAALVALGRLDEAEQLTARLDTSTAANHLPWSTAMASRCHGLLYAARGDFAAALAMLERALVEHERLPMPFEEARTRLLWGTVLRRAGHRTDARKSLEAARDVFVRLGTPVQAAQAREELLSLGGRHAEDNQLTTVEQRVAGLVGAGQTNREVADTLFMSVRTVESHLGRVYRKLGVRSRTELAHNVPAPAPGRRPAARDT